MSYTLILFFQFGAATILLLNTCMSSALLVEFDVHKYKYKYRKKLLDDVYSV